MKKDSRRSFLTKSVLGLGLGSSVFSSFASKKAIGEQASELPSLKGRKVLFTYGGWQGHEPTKFREYFVPWLKEEGAEVEARVTTSPYADADIMQSIDLVIQQITMDKIQKEEIKGLVAAVKNGVGMAGWHGGMCDSFRNNTEYQFMTGGQFVAHPGGQITYKVSIVDQADPCTTGISDFELKTEQYYMHVDPNMKVLATTSFSGEHADWIEGCTMPVIWKKYHGKGRIFYSSLGHQVSHLTEIPGALETVKRGIKWASASKYAEKESWVQPVYGV